MKKLEFVSSDKEKEFMEKFGDQIQDGKPLCVPPGYFRYTKRRELDEQI